MTVKIAVHRKTQRVLAAIGTHPAKFKHGIEMALYEIGKEVNRETQKLIRTGAKTGRIYRIKGMDHQASAPHEAPANLSGKLADSNDYKVRNFAQMEVGETEDYAGFLEEGTRKMKPRPHLLKAVNNQARSTQLTLEEYVAKEISKL